MFNISYTCFKICLPGMINKLFAKSLLFQHKSNSNQVDSQVDSYSNFLRILSKVVHYRLFGCENFDENTSDLFTKHGLEKAG